ncbi:unnamed protein product [Closterium sp. Yama58-4]|nr:unnamed protein product [Closterium sp. Yama58-4]
MTTTSRARLLLPSLLVSPSAPLPLPPRSILSDNNLTGPVPPLDSLPAIATISLYDNHFTRAPAALLSNDNVTLQLYGNDLCVPYRPEVTTACSPPLGIMQYQPPPVCDDLSCPSLYAPSPPLLALTNVCVCVSPLEVELKLTAPQYAVFNDDLASLLVERIAGSLGKNGIGISTGQAQQIREAFVWHKVVFGTDFGPYIVEAMYGPAPPPAPPAASTGGGGMTTAAIVGIVVGGVVLIALISLLLVWVLLLRNRNGDLWSSEDYRAIEGLQALGVHRCKLKEIADATQGFKTLLGEGGYGQVQAHGDCKCDAGVQVKMLLGEVCEGEGGRIWEGADWCKLTEIADATQRFKTLLGEGGYGQVYRGVLENGDVVAVKRAKGHVKLCGTEFRNEIQLLSAVRHRNLVALKGFCVEAGEQLLVYEFIERGTLEDMLRADSKHQLTWRQRVNIACGAASGFAYLHHQIKPPIIHRDVKTANILITADLEAKVADFGISKAVPEEAEGGGRLETQVKGTVFQSDLLTKKSDVCSIGIVLLELAAGLHRSPSSFPLFLSPFTLHQGYLDPQYFPSDLLTEKSDVYSFGIGYLDPQYFESDLLTEKSDVYSFGIVLLELAAGYLDPQYFQSDLLTEKSDVYSFGIVLLELATGLLLSCSSPPSSGPLLLFLVFENSQKPTLPQGYLDPQYFQSDLLTEKSDVYSFGIVLLELATGLRPVTNGEHIRRIVIDRVTNHGGVHSVMDPVLKAMWERGDGEGGGVGGGTEGGTGGEGGGGEGGGTGGGEGGGTGGGEGGTEGGGEGGGGEVGMSERGALVETCGSEALEETFEWFLRLAMRCSLKQAQNRPDMQQVLKELEGIKRRLNWVSASRAGGGSAGGAAGAAGVASGVAGVVSSGVASAGAGAGDSSRRGNSEGYAWEGEPVKEEGRRGAGQEGVYRSSGGDGLSPMGTFNGSVQRSDVVPSGSVLKVAQAAAWAGVEAAAGESGMPSRNGDGFGAVVAFCGSF